MCHPVCMHSNRVELVCSLVCLARGGFAGLFLSVRACLCLRLLACLLARLFVAVVYVFVCLLVGVFACMCPFVSMFVVVFAFVFVCYFVISRVYGLACSCSCPFARLVVRLLACMRARSLVCVVIDV